MAEVRGGLSYMDADRVIESESGSCADDDMLKGSPSSSNMFTASDAYHTDGDDESDCDTMHTSPLRPRNNHVYSRNSRHLNKVSFCF